AQVQEYYLCIGDVLEISIWNHPNLTRKVRINPDGYLYYPLAGKIKAIGLTVDQLQASLKEKLSLYIRVPDVTVLISEISGNKIIILGEVQYPGVYTYEGVITIVDAIALAGDITRDAKMESLIVVSDNLTDHPKVKRVDLFKALRKGSVDRALLLTNGDIVYVPRHFIADFTQFMRNVNVWAQAAYNAGNGAYYMRTFSKPLDKQ
ncbi:MAG: polysaccharide export protein, partial [Candidatus Omnitrophica bacterium]|nr:polysaccharide export protein [Candidatus Omnitrophota bacterium]